MRIDLGSRVRSSDGRDAGKIKRIIFDPGRMAVREFVIREGTLFREDRIVDLSLIEGVDEAHAVTLKVPADEINDLPVFIAESHTPVFTGDLHHAQEAGVIVQPGSVPRDAVVLSHGSQVYDVDDKHIGHLDEVDIADEGEATAFIVDSGFLFDRETVVPADVVASITHGRIGLKVGVADIQTAPAM